MTIFNETDHPRSGGGEFTNKTQSAPEIGPLAPAATWSVTSEDSDGRRSVHETHLTLVEAGRMSEWLAAAGHDKTYRIEPDAQESGAHYECRARAQAAVERLGRPEMMDGQPYISMMDKKEIVLFLFDDDTCIHRPNSSYAIEHPDFEAMPMSLAGS
jgi:hypothetical protein